MLTTDRQERPQEPSRFIVRTGLQLYAGNTGDRLQREGATSIKSSSYGNIVSILIDQLLSKLNVQTLPFNAPLPGLMYEFCPLNRTPTLMDLGVL